MSHYTIKYNTDTNQAIAENKACLDTLQYLGARRYKIIARQLRANCKIQQARFMFSMTGVQGFPVYAMCRRYHWRFNQMLNKGVFDNIKTAV